jgi:uncharacterized ion transporter superfamily protein YfcC
VFGILQRTGTIAAIVHDLLARFAASGILLPIILMIVVAIGGSTFGMGEELIPLVPVFLLVSREMGCDRIFGLSLVFIASGVGFAAATTMCPRPPHPAAAAIATDPAGRVPRTAARRQSPAPGRRRRIG